MSPQLSDFDIDLADGMQAESAVRDIQRTLADRTGTIEVKRDHRFVEKQRFYVERECLGRDGIWRPSGIEVTKATLWAFVLGKYQAMFFVETRWLKRAVALASQDVRNLRSHDEGDNPTRGVLVYINHLIKTREAA